MFYFCFEMVGSTPLELFCSLLSPHSFIILLLTQNDRGKALKAMETTWNNMEKKEKLMWIKKAAEDQKRYEV